MSIDHVKTVQEIYAAFGQGDVATILARVSPGTRWSFNGGRPDQVPYHAPVGSRDELPAFFGSIVDTVEFTAFEPREFMANGPHVVVEVHLAFRVKRTGRTVDQSQLHWWTFDRDGKVARLVHYEDTAQVVAAAA